MLTAVTFSMDIEVHDPERLYRAARANAFEHFQTTPFDARETMRLVHEHLRDDAGEINLAACVHWLADPGASDIPGISILDSQCERLTG